MTHLINPYMLDGFIDDSDTSSVQGAVIGSEETEQERQLDEKMRRERMMRHNKAKTIRMLREEFDRVMNNLVIGRRKGVREETLDKHRKRLFEIKVKLEKLEQ